MPHNLLMAAGESVARCLNCQAVLNGPFCASCGQRAVPSSPTVRELAGDAWAELTGYDGRIARTARALLLAPGRLTREYLEGHRVRYLSPVRLYLTASVIYFVIAASAPTLQRPAAGAVDAGGLRVGVVSSGDADLLDADDRRELQATVANASPWLRPMLQALLDDPIAFRRRVFDAMPRVFFAMLPLFAVITALFFRRRTFPTHLTFATHVHTFAFVAASVTELAKFTRVPALAQGVSAIVGLAIAAYGLRAFKVVYAEPWARTTAKVAGVALLYLLAAIPAFFVILAWASFTR